MRKPNKTKGIWLLADVDDNLITTRRSEPEPGSIPAAWDADGEVCGYLTPKQQLMLDWLQSGCEVVPNTARSSEAWLLMKLPFRRYAITAFGGTILGANRKPLKRWHNHIRNEARFTSGDLRHLCTEITQAARNGGIDARIRVLSEYGIDMFLSVKHNQRNLEELGKLANCLRSWVPQGWTVHLNGNFLAAYPAHMGKEKATKWFIENVVPEGAVTIGMGDSHTDVPFMAACGYAFMPTNAQNFKGLLDAVPAARRDA